MKRRTIIMVLFMLLIVSLSAVEISGFLKAEMEIKDLYLQDRFDYKPELIRNAIELNKQNIFLHFREKPSLEILSELSRNGVRLVESSWIPPCENHSTGFMLATIDINISILERLKRFDEIKRITSAEGQLRLYNDLATEATGADFGWGEPYGLTGEGVKVGIIDSGFDIDHPDIPEPVFGIDYSEYPDSNYVIDNTNTGTGHGTHVAGIALGSGELTDGVWRGMAANSDFYAYKVAVDGSGAITESALVQSIFSSRFNHENDIINMSLGGFTEFNDGSDEVDHVVDLVSDDGCLVFCATGNDVGDGLHYSADLSAGEESEFIAVNYNDSIDTNRDVLYTVNMIWYDGEDPEIQAPMNMEFYNQNQESLMVQSVYDMTQSERGTQARMGLATVIGTNTFYIKVNNESEMDLNYHLYITSYNGSFSNPDSYYTIGSPALADKAIAVGSWTTRKEFTNWQGLSSDYYLEEVGEISTFSNRGPRVDGFFKPDIAAPGAFLIAPRDDDAWGGPPFGIFTIFVISNSYAFDEDGIGLPADYIALQGTSMASPAAAGTAALLKEYDPTLTREEIVALIHEYAEVDDFTEDTPNYTWGHGKINLENILSSFNSTDEDETTEADLAVSQNYPNPAIIDGNMLKSTTLTTIKLNLRKKNNVKIKIYNLKGQRVRYLTDKTLQAGEHTITWNGRNDNGKLISSGIYYYKVETNNNTKLKKIVVLK